VTDSRYRLARAGHGSGAWCSARGLLIPVRSPGSLNANAKDTSPEFRIPDFGSHGLPTPHEVAAKAAVSSRIVTTWRSSALHPGPTPTRSSPVMNSARASLMAGHGRLRQARDAANLAQAQSRQRGAGLVGRRTGNEIPARSIPPPWNSVSIRPGQTRTCTPVPASSRRQRLGKRDLESLGAGADRPAQPAAAAAARCR
jgi:hypothetical protein